MIFHPDDDKLLKEHAENVVPNRYVPIIPMILVNGARGIGIGKHCYF